LGESEHTPLEGTIPFQVRHLIEVALEEDLASGDPTTEALILDQERGRADAVVRAPGVLAGTWVFAQVFTTLDQSLSVELLVVDGSHVTAGERGATVSGSMASILKAERVALNFLQRISGIATETARYVAAAAGLPVRIVDTRKTVPGMRWLDKYAVRMGGGFNHRLTLSDGILVKDNHLAVVRGRGETFKTMLARPQGGSRWKTYDRSPRPAWIASLSGPSPTRLGPSISVLRSTPPDDGIITAKDPEASDDRALSSPDPSGGPWPTPRKFPSDERNRGSSGPGGVGSGPRCRHFLARSTPHLSTL
jgi:hypothetical protein